MMTMAPVGGPRSRNTLTLYSALDDVVCHRVRLVLAAKGVTYDLVPVDPQSPPEDLIDLNPYQSVPTLVERDLVLYAASVVSEYLDERYPHPTLMPMDPISRARVYVLKPLVPEDIAGLLGRALVDAERGLGAHGVGIEPAALDLIAQAADGDARRALNMLDLAVSLAEAAGSRTIALAQAEEVASGGRRRFDKGGEQFYDQISALHKSVRGSDPDAALYWCMRMLDGGCDPHYLARRVVRMAIEDIGLADPRGITLALEAWQIYERLGSPEGELAIAEAVMYLAVAAKSNAAYVAFGEARADVEKYGTLEVPLKLRNAPTRLMKELGYGQGYRYAHDEPGAFAAGERYLPDGLPERRYYRPVPRGLEIRIGEALERLRGKQ